MHDLRRVFTVYSSLPEIANEQAILSLMKDFEVHNYRITRRRFFMASGRCKWEVSYVLFVLSRSHLIITEQKRFNE